MQRKKYKYWYLGFFLVIVVTSILFIYKSVNPSVSNLTPKCFSYTLFGFRCPGCGSQRAIHQLLNGNFIDAFWFNPIMVLSIPYALLLVYLEWFNGKKRLPKLYATLFGSRAIIIVFILLVLYTLMRNIFEF